MKSSLLIGSNGYLGRHLSHYLELAGFNNRNYDVQDSPFRDVDNYQKLDITDSGSFECLSPDVDYIFLFSGLTGTANGFDRYKDFISVNETGLLNLLAWMRQSDCKARLVFPSTRLVYKGRKNHLLKEDDPKEARTIYAANKLAAENILWMYHNAFGIDYSVFRICVPYGNIFGGEYSYGTLGFFLSKALKGEDITLFGDGSVRRTFSHVSDICSVILKAVQLDESSNGVYNIGGENMSLLDAAKMVAGKFQVDVKFTDWPDMAKKLESDDTVFDDSRLREVCKYSYRYTLQNWLSEL